MHISMFYPLIQLLTLIAMLHKWTFFTADTITPELWEEGLVWRNLTYYYSCYSFVVSRFPIICSQPVRLLSAFIQLWTDTLSLYPSVILSCSSFSHSLGFLPFFPSILVSQGGSCWKETTLPCCRVCLTRTPEMTAKCTFPKKNSFFVFANGVQYVCVYITWIL